MADEDVQSWASREGLSDGTVQALADEGFTSLDGIKLLSAEEVTESFQKTKLLLLKECLALKKAIAKLSLGDSTAAPVSPSAPSASSPTGRSFQAAAPQYGHGRDQPDFGSTMSGVRAPSCDRSGEDVQSWASREGLSDGTVQALADEGFTSLDGIKLLSAEEVTESFQKTKLLLLKECLALKKAIAKLSLGDSTAAPVSPSAPSASSPTGRSFQAAAPQYGHGRDQPDFGSTMSGVRAPSCDRSGEDVQSWASREGLSDGTVQALADEGFTSLDDIKLLSAEEVTESFQKTKLLLLKECLALKKAIAKLSLGDSTAAPVSPSAPSALSPTGRSFQAAAPQYGHGRDQPDFGSTISGVRAPSCDQSGVDPLMTTQPKPGYVKSTKALFDQKPFQQHCSAGYQPFQQHCSAGYQPFQQQRSAGNQQSGRSWTKDQESKPKSSGFLATGYNAIKNVFGKTEPKEEFRFILLGKTGSGKSTTGNTILREKLFTCAMNFGSVTTECELCSSEKDGRLIEMMDCPGLYDTSKTQQEISVVIVQAVACTHPGPHAILYVIRLGRFTAEEFGVFNRLKALFDENVVKYMIVLFTGGDDLEREGKTLADLMQNAPKELIQVVEECGHRCLVFNNNAKDTKPQVEGLLKMVRKMNEENGYVPYNCPKYGMVGEGLENQVNKRLAEVNKRDLEREKYVQELEAETREKEETVKILKEEIRRKDQERERELEEQKEKVNREAEERRKMLEADKEKSSTAKEQEIKSFAEKLLLEQEKRKKEMEEAREMDRLKLEQMERERKELEEERRAAEREEQKRKERAFREEMRRMKEDIAKNEEQGWVDWAAGSVASVIASPFKLVGSWFS